MLYSTMHRELITLHFDIFNTFQYLFYLFNSMLLSLYIHVHVYTHKYIILNKLFYS